MTAEARLKDAISAGIQEATPNLSFLISAALIGAPRSDVSAKGAAAAIKLMAIKPEDAVLMFELGLSLAHVNDSSRDHRGHVSEQRNPEWQNAGNALVHKAYEAAPDKIDALYRQWLTGTEAAYHNDQQLNYAFQMVASKSTAIKQLMIRMLQIHLRKKVAKMRPARITTLISNMLRHYDPAQDNKAHWIERPLADANIFSTSHAQGWLWLKDGRALLYHTGVAFTDFTDLAAVLAPVLKQAQEKMAAEARRRGIAADKVKLTLTQGAENLLTGLGDTLLKASRAKNPQGAALLDIFHDQLVVTGILPSYAVGSLKDHVARKRGLQRPADKPAAANDGMQPA